MIKKFTILLITITFLTQSVKASFSTDQLKEKIREKGGQPLIKIQIDDDREYKNLLEKQYEFLLDEEIKIIKDIKIAENTCKLMGFNNNIFKKKKFNKCVLEVWQIKLNGKKFMSLQNQTYTKNFNSKELQKYFDDEFKSFNENRKAQLKNNKKLKKEINKLKRKDKLEKIDYKKIVAYAIGIAVTYYIGKTILDSLSEAKAVKEVSQSASSVARKGTNTQNIAFCNYGRMLYVRYGIRHGSLMFCNK